MVILVINVFIDLVFWSLDETKEIKKIFFEESSFI